MENRTNGRKDGREEGLTTSEINGGMGKETMVRKNPEGKDI